MPVKRLDRGKSRIAMPTDRRIALNAKLLEHVLGVVIPTIGALRCLVVSEDDMVLTMARHRGARVLREPEGDLNDALTHGARFAAQRGAGRILSIFSDLPWLDRADVAAMVAGFDPREVTIAPDEAGGGTNAMLMTPAHIPYRHGPGSCWSHLTAVREAGAGVRLIRRAGLARDLDTETALAAWLRPTEKQATAFIS